MHKISFECETVTPMYLGGANKEAELRPPSIKAAMRFWWRAFNSDLSDNELRTQEAKIFGGAYINKKGEEVSVKSVFSIRIKTGNIKPVLKGLPPHPITVTSKGKTFSINILEYLAYGLFDNKSKPIKPIREMIPVGSTFEVELIINENAEIFTKKEIEIETLKKDLIVLFNCVGVIGGLGAKARNGFGRFAVVNPENKIYSDEIITYFKALFIGKDYKNFTAFSKNYKLYAAKNLHDTWDDALAELGVIYRETKGLLEDKYFYNKRQYIASPIMENNKIESVLERHTKCYFLFVEKRVYKINEKKQDKFRGYILFLPYNYLAGYNDYVEAGKKLDDSEITSIRNKYLDVHNEFNDFLIEPKMKEVSI